MIVDSTTKPTTAVIGIAKNMARKKDPVANVNVAHTKAPIM